MIASDTLPGLRQDRALLPGGIAHMPSLKSHARWSEALRSTVLLWSFVLLVFLPVIVRRHPGEAWIGTALDSATILYSMALAMGTFLVSRATIGMNPLIAVPLRVLAVLAAAAANSTIDLLFQGWIANNVVAAWHSLPADFNRAYSSTLNYILVFGVNMVLFHLNYIRRATIQQERQIAEANMAAQQAKLAALRYQLNPHFLFNSLNSISALIVTRRNDDAEAMTTKLSNFLRSSLGADPAELIPLEDELALTEEYLDIESIRFGDRLDVAIDCAADAGEALVPSFLIHPLVENAVKHGVARSRAPVTIEIGAKIEGETLQITVANCLIEHTGLMLPNTGSGVGLENVRRRLAAVFGARAGLEVETIGDRFVATISIPEIKLRN